MQHFIISDEKFVGPLKPRVLIIGHSFVSRIDKSNLQSFFPRHWEMFCAGKPGGKITDMREIASYYINECTPDYVYVQIRGNDIKTNTNPSLILFNLMETIYFIKNLGPFSVFVGGIFPRKNPRFIDS